MRTNKRVISLKQLLLLKTILWAEKSQMKCEESVDNLPFKREDIAQAKNKTGGKKFVKIK